MKKIPILDWIKSLDKKDIAHDERGRVIIRLPEQKQLAQPEAQSAAAESFRTTLSNRLIHPEDRIIRKSISSWVEDLSLKLKSVFDILQPDTRARKLAEVYNNAALIFFSLGDISRARELCYSQIQLFLKKYSHYAYQPWINLSRIDRSQGRTIEALEKLYPLANLEQDESLKADPEIYEAVQTCSFLEPVKVYLQAGWYHELLRFVREKNFVVSPSQLTFLQEAEAVALSNTGQGQAALDLLRVAKRYSSPVLMPVFTLRECEITRDPLMLQTMFQFTFNKVSHPTASINAIIFALHAAEIFQKTQSDKSIRLIYASLRAAKTMGDEIFQADCLAKLYQLMTEEEDKSQIESLLRAHYGNTYYKNAQKKMLAACPEISGIPTQPIFESAKHLFEKLSVIANDGIDG